MLVHLCAERHPHRHAPPSSQSASSPSLPVVARCSLDGCRLMDESPLSSSVKAPLYQVATAWAPHIWLDPSGSQFPPVIAHTAKAGDAKEAAIGAQRLTRWGRHFGARRGYRVKLGLAWPVLHLAGEECDKGILGESGFSVHHSWYSIQKASFKILSFKFNLHESMGENREDSSKCVFDSRAFLYSLLLLLL